VELADEDQSVGIDFTVPEALRPARGPGLALAEEDRPRRIVSAGGFLGLDTVLATSFADEGGVPYLVGALYDVRRGMRKLEGRVRLGANRSVPAGGIAALAEFLVTGQPNRLVEEPARPEAKPAQALDLKPRTPEKAVDLKSGPPSRTKGWIAFGTGVGAVALGGVALWQGLAAKSAYDDARKIPIGSADYANRYNAKVKDGDSANKIALGAGIGAGVCVVTSGVLGYLAYKQTGEIGPFRF
jgi:F0F1-type ATP synthase membrane subunit c/vacuolar-type H+-ATPase subunit K